MPAVGPRLSRLAKCGAALPLHQAPRVPVPGGAGRVGRRPSSPRTIQAPTLVIGRRPSPRGRREYLGGRPLASEWRINRLREYRSSDRMSPQAASTHRSLCRTSAAELLELNPVAVGPAGRGLQAAAVLPGRLRRGTCLGVGKGRGGYTLPLSPLSSAVRLLRGTPLAGESAERRDAALRLDEREAQAHGDLRVRDVASEELAEARRGCARRFGSVRLRVGHRLIEP